MQTLPLHTLQASEIDFRQSPPRTPALVIGADDGWAPSSNWSPEALQQRLPNTQVPISYSETGAFGYLESATWEAPIPSRDFPTRRSSLHGFLQNLDDAATNLKTYVMAQSFTAPYSGLTSLFKKPTGLQQLPVATSLWIGQNGTGTSNHFDATCSLIVQCYGSKLIRLTAPDTTCRFELFPRHSTHPHLVARSKPPHRSPSTLKPNVYEARLDPGHALIIPSFWFHEIQNTSSSLSIHFNWNQTPNFDQIPENLSNLIPLWFSTGQIRKRFFGTQPASPERLLALAKAFEDSQDFENAILLAASVIQLQLLGPDVAEKSAREDLALWQQAVHDSTRSHRLSRSDTEVLIGLREVTHLAAKSGLKDVCPEQSRALLRIATLFVNIQTAGEDPSA